MENKIAYAATRATDRSRYAIAGFVLGLIGLVAWILPLAGAPITITGLVLGCKGMSSRRKAMATTGAVLSGVGILLTIISAGIGLYWSTQNRSDAEAIRTVFAQDTEASVGANSVAEVVSRMSSIDLSKCPADFAEAYTAHVGAWQQLKIVEDEAKANEAEFGGVGAFVKSFVRGAFGDPLGEAKDMDTAQRQLRQDARAAGSQIDATFTTVKQIAISHGVTPPSPSSSSKG